MTKYTIDHHLGKYVCVYLNNGDVMFGVLQKCKSANEYSKIDEYTLIARNGKISTFRAFDVKKLSESRRDENRRQN